MAEKTSEASSLSYINEDYRSELLKDFGFPEEVTEVFPYRGDYNKTGFPEPKKCYHISWEVPDLSLEGPYFWILQELEFVFSKVEKLEDSFSAAEHSAFFGIAQQRIGAQQEKVSQFLATTGKMIKELFQMVRELRILDERLKYYNEAEAQLKKELSQRGRSAEITLKGLFVDLVQQGAKSAASVFGMARELEFITLPDLFFDAPPFKDSAELERYVKNLSENFNRNLLRVLERHLRQFLEWKQRTAIEHRQRHRFMLQYLLQHFEIIQMYINWVKPYLRNVARMSLNPKNNYTPDLVAAFEGAVIDIELLARKMDTKKGLNGCILATFRFRTRPEMKVVQESYNRGPVHIGRFEMQFRIYGWTDEQVEKYKALKAKESFYLIGNVSSAVQKAMESLGEELDHYLEEARSGKKKEEKEQKEPEKKTLMQKFLGDFYTAKPKAAAPKAKPDKPKLSADEIKAGLGPLVGHARFHAWNIYKNFKKAQRLVAW